MSASSVGFFFESLDAFEGPVVVVFVVAGFVFTCLFLSCLVGSMESAPSFKSLANLAYYKEKAISNYTVNRYYEAL